ncbi:NAD(P)-binding protein [Gonapodya prolifera JEL478]|uniref:NAD(P)-binding protein n=1 Tax=Gonapodya prolifera (strain JEL478) TaxID=1344416 RepID=A0A139A7I3_GONPJ|nr:NAD(P)-binding protein [Gonapodya prolifera JEL478]|eukprot:KXS12756.1 NAD(P)-binding protein [Gonapodya prolifera JEL478]
MLLGGPCGCAGVTVIRDIKRAKVHKGGWIGVAGAGGLGLIAIQLAKALGYKILATDVDDSKLAEAPRVGADVVVNAAKVGDKLCEEVIKLTDGDSTATSWSRLQQERLRRRFCACGLEGWLYVLVSPNETSSYL